MANGVFLPIVSSFIDKGIKDATKELKSLQGVSAKAGFAVRKAAVPAAAALTGLAVAGLSAAKAAAEDAEEQAKLAGQLRRSTNATDAQIASVEEMISKLSMSAAVADSELRPALASLVTGTQSVATAQKLLNVALDVSAATGKDLQTVSDALSKGYNGNQKALAQLSPELKTLIKEGATFSEVLDVLDRNFGNASEEAAATAAGGFRRFEIAVDEAQESIGTALLPVMEALLPLIIDLANWVGRNAPLVAALGVSVGIFSGAIVAANVALLAWKAAGIITTAVNAALATSFTAVQVATGIGIVTALAGAAALVTISAKIKDATKITQTYADTTASAAQETGFLKNQIDAATRAADARRAAEKKAEEDAAKAAITAERRAEDLKRKLADLRRGIKDDLGGAVEKANEVLTAAKKQFADFAQSVSETVTSSFSFADAKEAADEAGTGFLAGLEAQVKKIRDYSVLVNRLIAAGLSETALQQVLAAGTDAGSAIATELLNGGASAIAQANALTAEVNTLGTTVGNNAATQFRSEGITAGNALVAGINEVVSKYKLKLSSKKLTAKQLQNIQKNFGVEVDFLLSGGVPALADGGIVKASSGGTLALIGEGGKDEAVIPLDRGGIGGPTIIIQGAIDPVSTARQIEKILAGQTSRFGY
jgi:hypothetical protein